MDKNSRKLYYKGLPGSRGVFYSLRTAVSTTDRKPEIIEVTHHKGDCACVCGKARPPESAASGGYRAPGSGRFTPVWPEKMQIKRSRHSRRNYGWSWKNRIFVACLVPEYELLSRKHSCRRFLFFSMPEAGRFPCTEERMEETPRLRQLPGRGAPSHAEDMITAFERRASPGH